jgi:hypothetical protein
VNCLRWLIKTARLGTSAPVVHSGRDDDAGRR